MLKTWLRQSISQHNLKIPPRTNVQTSCNCKLRAILMNLSTNIIRVITHSPKLLKCHFLTVLCTITHFTFFCTWRHEKTVCISLHATGHSFTITLHCCSNHVYLSCTCMQKYYSQSRLKHHSWSHNVQHHTRIQTFLINKYFHLADVMQILLKLW